MSQFVCKKCGAKAFYTIDHYYKCLNCDALHERRRGVEGYIYLGQATYGINLDIPEEPTPVAATED